MIDNSNIAMDCTLMLDGSINANTIRKDGVNQIHVAVLYKLSSGENGTLVPDQDNATVTLISYVSGKDVNHLDSWQVGWSYSVTPGSSVGGSQGPASAPAIQTVEVSTADVQHGVQAPLRKDEAQSSYAVKHFFVSNKAPDGPMTFSSLSIAAKIEYSGQAGTFSGSTMFGSPYGQYIVINAG